MKLLYSSTAIGALASILSLSAPANATDIFNEVTTPPDAYSKPVPTWGGVVVGGAVGYSATNLELDGRGFNFDGISARGIQGCGILGAQKQMGMFVAGAEGRGCYADISTDLTFRGKTASLELDKAYSAYAKFGVAHWNSLFSALGGYRWQHYKLTGFGGNSSDDTIGGISGGLMFEKKLDAEGKVNFGIETIFTQFDEQDAKILNIDPTQFESNLRLTYTFGN